MGKINRVEHCWGCYEPCNLCTHSKEVPIPSDCPLPDDPTERYTAALANLADQMEAVRKERDMLAARLITLRNPLEL